MRACSDFARQTVGFVTSLLVMLSLTIGSPPAVGGMPNVPAAPAGSSRVYAKIILPMKQAAEAEHPVVESWIAKRLHRRGATQLRAVTDWVCLAERGEEVVHLWNATVDGKTWGCPVAGQVVKRTAAGKVRVRLSGWSPFAPEIKGETLPAETGSRRIAIVDTGAADGSASAYVALFIGPPPVEAAPPLAKQD